jgi:hypothetical protein
VSASGARCDEGARGNQLPAERREAVKFIGIVVFMILFVVLYIWQNVEVMKMKMDCGREAEVEAGLIRQNDRLRYEIETLRRMNVIEEYARSRGMHALNPGDIDVVDLRGRKR